MFKKIGIRIFFGILLAAALAAAGYFYYKYQTSPGRMGEMEIKKIVNKLGKYIVLPNEQPTLATVTDATKLSNQKFFEKALNGDKVLIYPLSAKAILYRPAINKIVEVASVQSMGQNPSLTKTELTQTETEVVSEKIQLALENGTKTPGLTNKFEKNITDKFTDVAIKSKESALSSDYQQTIVVDLSGKYKQRVNDLANFLEAKISSLPKGEKSPEADILVIFGQNSVK